MFRWMFSNRYRVAGFAGSIQPVEWLHMLRACSAGLIDGREKPIGQTLKVGMHLHARLANIPLQIDGPLAVLQTIARARRTPDH